MKPLKFSETSWHYRLARFGDSYQSRNLGDICGYTQAVFAGSVLFLMVVALVILAAFLVGDTLAWLVALIVQGWSEPSLLAGIVLAFFVAVLGVLICAGICHLCNKQKPLLRDSFVGSSYRSFKHRYCVPIEIVRKDQQ